MDGLCRWLLNGKKEENSQEEPREVHNANSRKRNNSRKRDNPRKRDRRNKRKKMKRAQINSLKNNQQSSDGKEVFKNLFGYGKFFVKATETEAPPEVLDGGDEYTIHGSIQKISTPANTSANGEANAISLPASELHLPLSYLRITETMDSCAPTDCALSLIREGCSKDNTETFSTVQNGSCVPDLDRRPFFQCAFCALRFSQRGILSEHIVEEHRTKDKPKSMAVEACPVVNKSRQCKVCNAVFSVEGTLQQHILKNHFNKIYDCSKCPKAFCTDALRKKHIDIAHNLCKAFCCKKCPKSFHVRRALSGHVMVKHPEDVNFQCQECGKRFVHEDSLSSHVYSHAKNKKLSV